MPYGLVMGKELADVFERQVLPRLVGARRKCSRPFLHTLNPRGLISIPLCDVVSICHSWRGLADIAHYASHNTLNPCVFSHIRPVTFKHSS
jgi:hypothetical protein